VPLERIFIGARRLRRFIAREPWRWISKFEREAAVNAAFKWVVKMAVSPERAWAVCLMRI